MTVSERVTCTGWERLTLAGQASAVDGCAHDHDIVDDGETALAARPLSLLVLDPAIRQHGGLVHLNALFVERLGEWQFIFGEKVPAGTVDNLVWSPAQDVDNGIGRVEDAGVGRQVWTTGQQRG